MSFRSFFSKIASAYRWFRSAVLNLLFICFILLVAGVFAPSPTLSVPDSTALHLIPAGMLVDQLTHQPSALDLFNNSDGLPTETRVAELVDAISRAANDKRVSGMVLQLDYFIGGGLSKMIEVGQALDRFKESGKPIIATAENYTQQQYFLASYADEIIIQELGSVLIHGFGVYRNYFLEAEKKLALDVHVFRVGGFKDAVEPFLRNDMSAQSKKHNREWLNELWQTYAQNIEQRRALHAGDLARYITDLGRPDDADTATLLLRNTTNAQVAKNVGLVDSIMSMPDIRQLLVSRFGWNSQKDGFNRMTHQQYLLANKIPLSNIADKEKNNIGLIVASGNIVDGDQPKGAIGGDSLATLLRTARDDASLSALILRMDSGGGSVFASEVIRQEILATREAGLPVYISMGSVAASGGYWVATAADEIWATPQTITGSIGVFGVVPNISRTLNKVGVSSDGFGTSALADIFHPDRPLADEAKAFFQHSVNNIYSHFIHLVAESRDLSVEQTHELAQGRVWTGTQAKNLGLVDNLGSLRDVIEHVATQQQLDTYHIKEIEQPLSTQEQILLALEDMMQGSIESAVSLPDSLQWLQQAEQRMSAAFATPLKHGEKNQHKALILKTMCLTCEAL